MRSQLVQLFRRQTENENVILANLLSNLNISAVHRADDQRAVEGEFHVAGAGSFGPGGRDLFRELGGWEDPLGQGDAVIREEYHPQQVPNVFIVVDPLSDGVDE